MSRLVFIWLFFTGPPTHSVGARLVTVSRLSSSVVCRYL